MTTAVAFIVFNRPDVTRRVLAAIREARPPRLFVIADGPRSDRLGEAEKCAEVRALVEAGVDWPCEVKKNYADVNLGCARRVSSGLDWVFEQVEEAIILEDDCLPDPTFFPFCEELLERYRNDERVAHISGTLNYWSEIKRSHSYVFSRYGSVWGWATWRRAWLVNDLYVRDWPSLKAQGVLRTVGFGRREASKREAIFDDIYRGNLHTWDYQWSLSKWRRGWLSICPVVPLIENIGMDLDGTHAPERHWNPSLVGKMDFPMRHPAVVEPDEAFEALWANRFAPSLWCRGWSWVRRNSPFRKES